MPHRCMRCERTYADDAPAVIDGCACGSRMFLFVRAGKGAPAGEGEDAEGAYDIDISGLLLADDEGHPHVRSLPEGTYEIDVRSALGRK